MSKYVYYRDQVWVVNDVLASDKTDEIVYKIETVGLNNDDVPECLKSESESESDINVEYVNIESDYIKEGLACPSCKNICRKYIGIEEKFDEYRCENKNCRVVEVDTPSWDLSEYN